MKGGSWFGLLLCVPLVAAFGQGDDPPLWAVGLSGSSAPSRLTGEGLTKPLPEECVLWQEGRALVRLPKDQVPPPALPEGRLVTVEARDEEGRVLPHVSLEYRPASWPNLPRPFGRVETDSEGRASLFLLEGEPHLLWAEDPRYIPGTTAVSAEAGHVVLFLRPAPPQSLRVKDPFGRDLADSRALYFPPNAPSDPITLMRERKSVAKRTTGDAQGYLPLEGLGAGGVYLWARGFGLKRMGAVSEAREVVLDRAAEVKVRVEIPPPFSGFFRVEVEHLPEGLPWLSVKEAWEFSEREGTLRPPAYPCTITLVAPGFLPERRSLAAPPSSSLDVSLRKGISVWGTVVDEKGDAIAGAWVSLTGFDMSPFWVTEEDGSFRLPPQPPEAAPFDLYVTAEDFLEATLGPLSEEKAAGCRVVLRRGGGLTGRVETGGGEVLPPDVNVDVAGKGPEGAVPLGFSLAPASDGSFSCWGLKSGSYVLRAAGEGLRSPWKTVEVGEGFLADAGVLRLEAKPRVSGRVVASDGSTVDAEGLQVTLVRVMGPAEVAAQRGRRIERPRLDEDGAFTFSGVPEGRYRVEARKGERSARSDPFEVADADVDAGDLRLQPEGSLYGRLLSRRGLDLSGYLLRLQTGPLDFEGPAATADREGRFAFEGVPPGSYTLAAFPPFQVVPKARRRVFVSADRKGTEVLLPVEGVAVTVMARLDGRPVANATVAFQAGHEEAGAAPLAIGTPEGRIVLGFPAPLVSAPTDGGGMALLAECPVGEGTAVLYGNGGEFRAAVFVPEEPREPLVWEFRGSRLEGRVVDGEGTPLSGVQVHWEYAGRGPFPGSEAVTGEDGRFVLEGLGAGPLRIWALDPERGSGEVRLSLPGAQGPVVLRLTREGPTGR